MIYRFKKKLENDDYAYSIMCEKLNELLREEGVPTEAGTELRSRNGLIALKPYPFKGFSEETERLKKIPGIIRVKKGRMTLNDGNIIIVISAHCNGLEMLRQIKEPEDEIVFYEEEKSDKMEEKVERIDLGI